jgi:hypothetical protein
MGEEIAFSTNGTGKTRYPHPKNKVESCITYKSLIQNESKDLSRKAKNNRTLKRTCRGKAS